MSSLRRIIGQKFLTIEPQADTLQTMLDMSKTQKELGYQPGSILILIC